MNRELPVFGVCGISDTGKTTLISNLIEELTKRGHDVVTIKHTKGEFGIDEEKKDTWRHAKAGAELVIFSTEKETDFLLKDTLKLDEIISVIRCMDSYDAVLIEGMEEADIPSIRLNPEDPDIGPDVQIISDRIEKEIKVNNILKTLPKMDCKRCGYKSCDELASAILEGEDTLASCEMLKKEEKGAVKLFIDEEKVALGKFPSQFIERTVKGMVSSLRSVSDMEEIEEIELKISERER